MVRLTRILAVSALVALAAAPATAATGGSPVVVELFTSQGCSSCPPADAYLGELAKRPGLVALAYHVDYWDYIGWKDPFALPQSTERQRRYTAALGNHFLYTPEIVVDGRHDATGSDRAAVGKLIDEARAAPKIPVTVEEPQEDHYLVKLPAAEFHGSATVWMAVFDKERQTAIARGENEGRTLREFNVVRELRRLGSWDGQASQISLDWEAKPENGCAILLQADRAPGDGHGTILGAAVISEK